MSILVYRLGSMGDFLVTLPAFKFIKRENPNIKIILLTNHKYHEKVFDVEEFFPIGTYFDEIVRYNLGTRNILSLLKIIISLRKFKIKKLYYLNPYDSLVKKFFKYSFFKIAGVDKIIGPHLFRNNLGKLDSNGMHKNIGIEIAELIGFPNIKTNDWELQLNGNEIDKKNKRYFVIATGTKAPIKEWKIENWLALINKLNTFYDKYDLYAIGTKSEWESNQIVMSVWKGGKINYSGLLNLNEVAQLLKNSEFFIGLDSGLMHLAVSVNCKTFAIFSSQDYPGKWFPKQHCTLYYTIIKCQACILSECKYMNNLCINTISPELIFEDIKNYVSNNNKGSTRVVLLKS